MTIHLQKGEIPPDIALWINTYVYDKSIQGKGDPTLYGSSGEASYV